MPALRAPLCCSPVAGRQKLADAQTVWRLVPPPAPLLSGTEWGTARFRIPVQVRDIRMIPLFKVILFFYIIATEKKIGIKMY